MTYRVLRVPLLTLVTLAHLGCGSPVVHHVGLPELEPGTCGGLAELERSRPVQLMGGRISMEAPVSSEDPPRSDLLSAVPSAERETLFYVTRDQARLVVHATDLFRRAAPGMEDAVRRATGSPAHITTLGSGREAIVFVLYDRPERDGNSVKVADAYSRTADDMVARTSFFVSLRAAETRGCSRLVLELARTLRPGSRTLRFEPGEHELVPGVSLTIGNGQVLSMLSPEPEDADSGTFFVDPVLPFGGPRASMAVFFGPDARLAESRVRVRIDGHGGTWREWRSVDGMRWRETLVHTRPGRRAVIAFGSNDNAVFASLAQVAASVRSGSRRRSLRSCDEIAAPPETTDPARDEALDRLLAAERFTPVSEVFGSPRPPELVAFAALTSRSDATAAFRYLAEHATTPGRLFGLAGLYNLDRDLAESVLCRVRDELDANLAVLSRCGVGSQRTAELVESRSADAIRGEYYWLGSQWMRPGTADLRGGALPQRLLYEARSGRASELGGDGYVLAVAGQPSARRLRDGDRPAQPRIWTGRFGGLCWTRSDGRVACAGQAGPAAENIDANSSVPRVTPNVVLIPDLVRFPRDFADGDGSCVLDADGRRACFGYYIEEALARRQRECGIAAPSGLVYRVFDDGPWAQIVEYLGRMCGIREPDRALMCFAAHDVRTALPFVQDAQRGQYSAQRIPIEGRVAGVANGPPAAELAYTEDGALWEWKWNEYAPPRIVGRFDAPIVGVATYEWITFVHLADGRTFARGVDHRGPYADGDRWETTWRPIEELRDVRISVSAGSGHAAYARFPDGRVVGWGRCGAGALGPCEHGTLTAPRPLPQLSVADELFIADGLDCARHGAAHLSCFGPSLRHVLGADAPLQAALDLERLGAAARERASR